LFLQQEIGLRLDLLLIRRNSFLLLKISQDHIRTWTYCRAHISNQFNHYPLYLNFKISYFVCHII